MTAPSATWLTWANALTALRMLLIPVLAWSILQQAWLQAAAVFTLAALTDYYDGRIARALHQSSAWGGLFDHATDAALVTTACWALAELQLINPYLCWLIPAAFVQYMLDSKALAGRRLRTSRLGRSNGVAYFVVLGTAIGSQLLALQMLINLLPVLAWVLVATTALSMLDRGISLLQA